MKRKNAIVKGKRSLNGSNGLRPVTNRLNKFEKRMDRLETKVEGFRKETARDFKAVRKEMKQENRGIRADMAKYYFAAREENKIIANEHARTLTKILTTVDAMAKDYSRWLYEKQYSDAELGRHTREINALKEKDTAKENTLQDLQKRVAALEKAKNGRPVSTERVSK